MSELSRDPMRRALRALTHGVYILSVYHEGRDDYLTVSLVMQCSVEPPRIAVAVSVNARILNALRASQSAVLGILDVTAIAAVRRYGSPGGVRHPPADVTRTAQHHPVPPEVAFWLDVVLHSEYAAGDHAVFVADVTSAGVAGAQLDVGAFTPMTLAGTRFPYAG